MYNLILADGTAISNLTMNGTCYVSETEIDESIFEDNLSTMTVQNTEEGTEETLTNVEFIQQLHYENFHGNTGYYLSFREVPKDEAINGVSLTDRITALEEALIEIGGLL